MTLRKGCVTLQLSITGTARWPMAFEELKSRTAGCEDGSPATPARAAGGPEAEGESALSRGGVHGANG